MDAEDTSKRPDDQGDKRTRKQEFRRKMIMLAARDLFAKYDFQTLKVDEIADAAAVSKATLYEYFAGKAEVFEAILLSDIEQLIGGMEGSWSRRSAISTNIRRMTYFYITYCIQHPEYFMNMSFYFMPGRREPLPPEIKARVEEMMARGVGAIAAALESSVSRGEIDLADPRETATVLWCILEGAALAHVSGRCDYYDRDVYDIAIRGVDLVVSGLLSKALPNLSPDGDEALVTGE